MAQLIVSAAGAVAGFMIGGPTGAQIGWALGSMAYSMANPARSYGPRLSDLKVTGTEYGQPIQYCLGHPRVAGQLVYASQKYEIADTQTAGKGGGQEYTSYTYEVDLLYLLSDDELQGVSRIWLNGELIWTLVGDDTDPQATMANVISSLKSERWQRMTFYPGSADQLPDPDYEAAVPNATAYRGRATIFFKRLKLGSSGQLPQLTFEIFDNGRIPGGYLYAPLTADGNDTLSPYAITNISDPANTTFSANGMTITAPASGSDRTCNLSGWKISAVNPHFDDLYVTYQVEADFGPIIGTGTGNTLQFFSYDSSGPASHAGFGVRLVSGVLQLATSISNTAGVTSTVFHGPASSAKYGIRFNPVDTTVEFLVDGEVIRSVAHGRYGTTESSPQAITLMVRQHGNQGVTSITFKGLMVYEGLVDSAPSDRDLQSVVEQLCARAGMPSGSYDASALASITKPVRNIAISQVGATRATLEMLMQSHYFGAYVTDKLYFVPRGGTSAATIPFTDLGATTGDRVEPLPLKWGNELELPATVSVSYANVDADYNTAAEESDRLLTSQGSTSALQLAMGMTSAEAKGVANTAVADSVAALLTSTIQLPSSYSHLTPTDVVTVLGQDGSSYRMRIVKRTDSAGVLQLDVVRDDAQALQDVGISSTDYTPSTTVAGVVATLLRALDTPLLRDQDDSASYMLAACGQARPWPGGAAYASADGGATYAQAATFTSSSVIGTTGSVLGAWTGIGMDTANTVTVTLSAGQQLASTTRSALFADETLNALFFETGELVRFLSATLVSGTTYVLSGLLRGCRGTEWAMGLHTSGEDVVLLGTALRRVSMLQTEIGAARLLKGVTANRAVSTGTPFSFTPQAVCLKPLAPVQGAYAGGLLSWRRRSRYATQLFGPAGPVCPLGETAESYEVDLLDATDTVVQTIPCTTSSTTLDGLAIGAVFSALSDLRPVAGLLVGVNEPYPSPLDADVIVSWQTDGSALAASYPLHDGYAVQIDDDGTSVYVALLNGSSPSYLRKYTAADLYAGPQASYTGTAAADVQGVAAVSTSEVWIAEAYTQRLVKLNGSLAEVASHSVTGVAPSRMHYDGTSLWVCMTDGSSTHQLLQHNPSTNSEVQRITLPARAYDVRSNGTVVVAATYSALYVYLVADGSLLTTISAGLGTNTRETFLSTNGTQIYGADVSNGQLLTISASGSLAASNPIGALRGVAGIDADGMAIVARLTGSPANPSSALLTETGATTATRARIYQMSSVVGRGYPLEIPLT